MDATLKAWIVRGAACLTAAVAILTLSATPSGSQSQPSLGAPRVASKTTLQVTQYTKELEKWQAELAISTRQVLNFRWSTMETEAAFGTWEVTTSPTGFPGAIVASGQVPVAPVPGSFTGFSIDFSTILPASPGAVPKAYFVHVVPRASRAVSLPPSAPIKITYQRAGPVASIAPVFHIDVFEQKLKAVLDTRAVGYAYAVADDRGQRRSGSGGYAILGSTPQSADRRMDILSMSKTITAAAVMRALEDVNARRRPPITIDSRIAPYLPSDWRPYLGPHVDQITFKQLLAHTSGLRSVEDENAYASLRRTIQNGAASGDFGNPAYQNCNYSLFRVIIPFLVGDRAALESSASGDDTDARTSRFFLQFVQERVFARVPGLVGAGLAPNGDQTGVRYYDFSDPSKFQVGYSYDYNLHRAGPGFFFLSANELLQILTTLKSGGIVSIPSFDLMERHNLGMGALDLGPPFGPTWNHNGGFGGAGGGFAGDWMIFANRVTAVMMVNSVDPHNPLQSDGLMWETYKASVY